MPGPQEPPLTLPGQGLGTPEGEVGQGLSAACAGQGKAPGLTHPQLTSSSERRPGILAVCARGTSSMYTGLSCSTASCT